MMENKNLWYAVCVGVNDEDLGTGSENYEEAVNMAEYYKKEFPKEDIFLYTVDTKDSFVLDEEVF